METNLKIGNKWLLSNWSLFTKDQILNTICFFVLPEFKINFLKHHSSLNDVTKTKIITNVCVRKKSRKTSQNCRPLSLTKQFWALDILDLE